MLHALPRKGILKTGSFSAAITSQERKSKYRPKGNNLGGRMKKYYAEQAKRDASENGLGAKSPRKELMIDTRLVNAKSFAIQFEHTPQEKSSIELVP